MKIPNKRELHQIAIDHSSNINTKDINNMILIKKQQKYLHYY